MTTEMRYMVPREKVDKVEAYLRGLLIGDVVSDVGPIRPDIYLWGKIPVRFKLKNERLEIPIDQDMRILYSAEPESVQRSVLVSSKQ